MTQQEYQQYQSLARLIYYLQLETWPLEELDKSTALAEVIKISQVLGVNLDYTDAKFLPTVAEKIAIILSQSAEQPAPNIDLSRLREWEQQLEIANKEQKNKTTKILFPTIDKQIQNAIKVHQQKIKKVLISTTKLNEQAVNEISWKVAVENKLPVSRPEAFSEKEYQKIIEKDIVPALNQELSRWGVEKTQIETKKEIITEELIAQTYESAKTLAATPHLANLPLKPTSTPKEIPPFPKEILDEIKQSQEELVLPGAYILAHPKAGGAVIKRLASAPEFGLLKVAMENAPIEWQQDKNWSIKKEILDKRVFAEDYRATINWLVREKGFSKEDPRIQQLEDKFYELLAVQKNPQTNKDLPWVTIAKRYSYIDELLGRKRIPNSSLGYLPRLANEPLWSEENSWGGSLHRGLNRFRFIPNTSQRFARFATGGRYESVGGFIRKTLYQKAIKPALIRLGKTAGGKAAKNILIKFATGTASKLGLGAATGGWSLLISSLPMIKNLAKKALAFFAGLLIMAAHYGAAAFWGTVTGGIGGIIGGAWLGFKFGGLFGTVFGPIGGAIGAIVGLVVGGIIGFFGGIGIQMLIDKAKNFFSNFSIPEKIASTSSKITAGGGNSAGVAVGTTIATVGVGALIITQITTSAFIIPESEEFAGSPYIQLNKTGKFDGNEETGKGIITYQISVGAQDENLIEVKISDEISTRCLDGQPEITSDPIESPPNIINIGNFWKPSYTVKTKEDFKDCLVINRITVSAKTENQPEEAQEKTITYVIKIGNPPDDCPYNWPTSGIITSLPGDPRGGGRKHAGIDIANIKGTPIYNTHGGAVSSGDDKTGGKGKYIEVVGKCSDDIFQTVYYHLSEIKISSGNILGCSEIGSMGNTGNSYGPNGGYHLHYEIRGLGSNWWTNGEYFPKPKYNDQVTNTCL